MTNQSIGDLIRTTEDNYINGETSISKYVSFSQYENLEKIDAYLNSKFITGNKDSLGREKPFFNIVTGAVNIWYRATDIDRKNIRIKATKAKDYIGAFLATIRLQEWMRRENFGQVLNEWGRNLAKYGSAVLKFVEKEGKLIVESTPWSRLISDTVDFDNNIKIEKLYFTPSQLRAKKGYDQEIVKEIIDQVSTRETMDGQKKDNIAEYIEVYELHGNLPLSYLTGEEEDDDTYVQQMHVVSFIKSEESDEYDDFTLYKGREAKDPYMITHLIKEEGRSQSIGAVEHLFEAQWMVNHTSKSIKDQLDLASKLIFQTADPNFASVNVLSQVETGDIMVHAENKPLETIPNNSHDTTSIANYGTQWQNLAKEITSTPDAISGDTFPSGTAYRQVAILNQEAHSLFEIMTENKGLAIEAMMRKYIIPYLKKQMDTSEEVSATLSDHFITQLDALYIPNESVRRVNKKIKDTLLKGGRFTYSNAQQEEEIKAESNKIREELSSLGNQRFIKPSDIPTKTWKELFKDLEWDVEVEVTSETTDKEVVLTTLSTVLQTIANPATQQVLQTPQGKLIFNKILEETGKISPLELSVTQATPAPAEGQNQATGFENISKVGGGN